MLLWLLACTGGQDSGVTSEPRWVQLFDPNAWTEVGADADPFEDRPEKVDCSPLGYGLEGSYFEVTTDDCPYGTFQQALQYNIPAGTSMKVVYWHLDLWAPEPAQAHLAIQTETAPLLETFIDIPNGAEVYAVELEAPSDLPAGESVFFHIHNHGYNSWSLGGMEAFIAP